MNSSQTNSRQVTFILPCAGEGKRLGYSGHKELFPLLPDLRLIDFSLKHIKAAQEWCLSQSQWTIKIVAVIRPWKMEIPVYIHNQLPDIRLDSVFFDDNLFEWPGSVHSAQKFYSDINIVLLPDSQLRLSKTQLTLNPSGKPLVSIFLQQMQHSSVVFGYRPMSHQNDSLKCLGALHVTRSTEKNNFDSKDLIDRFQDKPDKNLNLYNAHWCCYGFSREMGEPLYQFLKLSVSRRITPVQTEIFHPAGAFPVYSYLDFGTPDAIKSFRENQNSVSNSSI